jgi:hypothetical protein
VVTPPLLEQFLVGRDLELDRLEPLRQRLDFRHRLASARPSPAACARAAPLAPLVAALRRGRNGGRAAAAAAAAAQRRVGQVDLASDHRRPHAVETTP